jgi:predicted regulator of Ras-like GTPase activity (Roadblock/LC7/MglB family)
MAAGSSVEERVHAELLGIRANVTGIHGSLVATSDGFLVSHDLPDIEPTQIAALVATTRALASRTTTATGRGQFREAVARGTDGYFAVYAAGRAAIVAVIGTSEMNVGMLQFQTREIIARIAAYSAEFEAWSDSGRGGGPAEPAAPAEGGRPGALPVRRPAPR